MHRVLINNYEYECVLGKTVCDFFVELDDENFRLFQKSGFSEKLDYYLPSDEVGRVEYSLAIEFVREKLPLIVEKKYILSAKEIKHILILLELLPVDAAKLLGVSKALISRLIKGEVKASTTFCIGIIRDLANELSAPGYSRYFLGKSKIEPKINVTTFEKVLKANTVRAIKQSEKVA